VVIGYRGSSSFLIVLDNTIGAVRITAKGKLAYRIGTVL
jgi:hypothetical protein